MNNVDKFLIIFFLPIISFADIKDIIKSESKFMLEVNGVIYTNKGSFSKVNNKVYGPNGDTYQEISKTFYKNKEKFYKVGNNYYGKSRNIKNLDSKCKTKNKVTICKHY